MTGRALLLYRLGRQDIRRHLTQALLLVAAIAVAVATLTMALALNGVNSNPYQQTRAATRGPDVVAANGSSPKGPGGAAATPAGLAALVALDHASGVKAHSGPFPMASAALGGIGVGPGVDVEGRPAGVAAVDQPKVTAGTWIRPGGVVVERSFAQAANLRLGQTITLNGRPLTVTGFAVTSAFDGFPGISLMWATEAEARSLASAASPLTYYSNLTLSDPSPSAVAAFVRAHSSEYDGSASSPYLTPWTVVAYQDSSYVRSDQALLLTGATLLGLLALASIAVLVGGRAAEGTRRVGLLKAVGATPDLVAATFLAENLFLALVAAFAGLLAGWGAAPLITNPEAGLVGAPGAPALTPATVVVAVVVALAVALASTLVPAVRAARMSTVSALADRPHQPRRRDSLVRLSRRLPVPALFGLRLVARRPRRAILSAASIAVTVMGVVAALSLHAAVGRKLAHLGSPDGFVNPDVLRGEQVLTAITISLVTLAALTAIFTALATVLDARRACAVSLALGATPQQVRAGLIMTQVIPALPGAILGLPLGIGLYLAAANQPAGLPPALWLVVTVLGTVFAVAALTTVPARISLRRPVGELLAAEAA